MRFLFLPLLPLVLPFAVRWARRLEVTVLRDGFPLDAQGLRDAKAMGVLRPEAVRVMLVSVIPAPRNPLLRLGAAATGLLTPMTAGLVLGHAILVRRDCHPDRLMIAHECVHVAQYERFGGQAVPPAVPAGVPRARLPQFSARTGGRSEVEQSRGRLITPTTLSELCAASMAPLDSQATVS